MTSRVVVKLQAPDQSWRRFLLEPVTYEALLAIVGGERALHFLPEDDQVSAENFSAGVQRVLRTQAAGEEIPIVRFRIGKAITPVVNWTDAVSFTVNGKAVTLDTKNIDPLMSLNEWIRMQPGSTGTKRMCQQGACGSCTVVLSRNVNGETVRVNASSCLKPLYTIDGFEVTTTEGLGNSRTDFSVVQKAIASGNGSQCGYCTPGFVMAMHGLLARKSAPSAQDIESNFDGNICRCTGYRPILSAMQTFACKSGETVDEATRASYQIPYKAPAEPTRPIRIENNGVTWYRPLTVPSLLALMAQNNSADTRLVVGNTSTGILPLTNTENVRIDINFIPDLKTISVTDSGVTFGGTVSLTDVAETLAANAAKSPNTWARLSEHILNVANINVRNVASWSGNFMITHNNDNWPSDLVSIFTAVGATVTVIDAKTNTSSEHDVLEIITMDTAGKLLSQLHVPVAGPNSRLETYKVNPRRQCSTAYVNSAFFFTFAADGSSVVASRPVLVFGGVEKKNVRAVQTEAYLVGRDISLDETLHGALALLAQELIPNPETGRVEYRQSIVATSFYRALLAMLKSEKKSLPPNLQDASQMLKRPISSGANEFKGATFETPVGQPMVKQSAYIQASGQAMYTEDGPLEPGMLYAQFVISTEGNAKIDKIDASAALAIPGVVDFVTSADIPKSGTDMIMGSGGPPTPLFATDRVAYNGQALGLIIATTQGLADRAAKAVKVTYSDIGPVVTTVQDAIDKKSFFPDEKQPSAKIVVGDVDKAFAESAKVVEGSVANGSQYHMHMETISAIASPRENNGFKVYSSTQYPSITALQCAQVIGVSANKVELEVRRLGGAYGGKILNPIPVTAACILAAYKLQLPVKLTLNLETNMAMMGKRYPYVAKYKVGASAEGEIKAVQVTYYSAAGWDTDGNGNFGAVFSALDNCYNIPNWKADAKMCKVNTAWNTAARAPGYAPAIFFMEQMVESVADAVGLDAAVVRQRNFYKTGDVTPYGDTLKYCSLADVWSTLLVKADYQNRLAAVNAFNSTSRYIKRGLCALPVKYSMGWNTANYGVLININGYDGSVQVNHSGVEMGQGIDTKVAQAVSFELGCPLEVIEITSNNTNINPNAMCTGGSIGSELNVAAAIEAAKRLRVRLATQRRLMPRDSPWAKLIGQCFGAGMDLSERYFISPDTPSDFVYNSYIGAISEVEVDLLTGQFEILRTDIEFDSGSSLNPEIDIGQIQGGFIMGVGWLTVEELQYDPTNARLMNANTLDYHVPSSQTIPQDFRVALYDKAYNPLGVLGSKAVGEPPVCVSASVFQAIRHAVQAGRVDAGQSPVFQFDAPATVTNIFKSAAVNPATFSLH